MVDLVDSDDVVRRSELVYEEKLRVVLERDHLHEFVAIEPDSGDFYLGQTLTEAVGKSRVAHPGCLSFVIRIGHTHAIHIGHLS